MRAAWEHVLIPIEQRLTSLHRAGIVDFGVAGFVHSDADSWRRFWRPVTDLRGAHAVACIAPHGECGCAMCAARLADTKRMGARASSGEGGAFVSSLAGYDDDDDDEEGGGGEGGPANFKLGTRVSGVARVHAESAGAALDLICAQLVSALHGCRGPPDVPEAQRTRKDGLYDVTWASGGKVTASHLAPAPPSCPSCPSSPPPPFLPWLQVGCK